MNNSIFQYVTLTSHLDLFLPVADPGFSPGGAPTPKIAIIFQIFAENCMRMKEFGPPGGASLAPPLDPPMPSVVCLRYLRFRLRLRVINPMANRQICRPPNDISVTFGKNKYSQILYLPTNYHWADLCKFDQIVIQRYT